jgi:hypothetical protein
LGGVGGCACDGSGMCIRTLRTLALSSMEAEFTQADDEGGLRRATINRWVSTWCSLDDVHIAPTSTGARVDTWECLLCTMQPKTVAKKKWVGDAFKSHFVCMHDLVGCYNLGKDSPASLCYPFATQTRRRALAEKTAAAKTKAPKAPQQSQPPPQPAPPLQVPMLLPAAAAPQPPPPAAAAPPQKPKSSSTDGDILDVAIDWYRSSGSTWLSGEASGRFGSFGAFWVQRIATFDVLAWGGGAAAP